jgi:hypothetical protein
MQPTNVTVESNLYKKLSEQAYGLSAETHPKNHAVFTALAGKENESSAALTKSERGQRKECEEILERGLGTFFEVGTALLMIRESRLYRDTHSSFEQYCHERWNIRRSYAWRVIGAAERMKLLSSDGNAPKPANEFQMRPFLKLSAEKFPGAWSQAVKSAKQGKVTTRIVQAVIRDLMPNCQDLVQAAKKKQRGKKKTELPVGHLLTLLHEAKRQVEKSDTEKVMAALEKIESLLCSA